MPDLDPSAAARNTEALSGANSSAKWLNSNSRGKNLCMDSTLDQS